MTYTELFFAIKNYLQSDFPSNTWTNVAGSGTDTSTGTEQIDLFIQQAEKRVYNTVQIPALRKNVTGALTPSNKYLSCPVDFLSVYSLAVVDGDGEYVYLLNKDVNYIREVYPSPTYEALPKYYALFGPEVINQTPTNELSFILGPTPDDNYTVELHYYYYPQSITVAAGGHTWLADNYSPVLLYGALVEGYIYLKGDPDMMSVYEKKFQDALAQLNRLGSGLERGDAYRDGQFKMKVGP